MPATTRVNTDASGVELPFEFCALRYLLQWQRKESSLYAKVREAEPSHDAIRKALRHFQVSQSFAGLKDDSRADSIKRALVSVRSAGEPDRVERVIRLAENLKPDFQYNLSAASKLLWLSDRKGLIFDSRAYQALKDVFGHTGKKADYRKYCESWRSAYKEKRLEIELAVKKLPSAHEFLPSAVNPSKLSALVSRPWFKERVFDIYLWELGSEG